MIAQYDGAIAYMDAAMQTIFTTLESLGVMDDTIIALNGDHGETLYDHECWFDHHGIYDNVLHVPLIIRYPGAVSGRASDSAATTSTKTCCRHCWSWLGCWMNTHPPAPLPDESERGRKD